MKAIKFGLVGAGLIFLLTFLPNTALARVSFGISIGTPFVYHYPGFQYGGYPHYGWHTGYYRWFDRDRYLWLDTCRYRHIHDFVPRHYYWHRPLCSSGLRIWIDDCCATVISPLLVVETPLVIANRLKAGESNCTSTPDVITAEQLEKLQQKKSELLKVLRIGDRERRIQAISELAGYSSDNKIRKALEKVLLSNPDSELRKEVAISFGKNANREAVPALQEVKAKDSNREVRQAAYKAIIMIQGY